MRLRTVAVTALVGMSLLGAACSKSSSSSPSASSSPSSSAPPTSGGGGGATATLKVKDFQFAPGTLNVSSGTTTITITNAGPSEHSFTLDDGSASVDIPPGESKTVVVNLTADATFHCRFHSTMTGTLKVG